MPGASSSMTIGGGGSKRRISEPISSSRGNWAGCSAPASASSSSMSITSTSHGASVGPNNSAGRMNGVVAAGAMSTAAVMKMKAETFEKDRDNFLTAFEKPTQIYRFLRARMVESPSFLQRNLSYMKGRFSRSHKSRDSFKVDTMLAEKLREQSEEKDCVSPRGLLGLIHSKKGPANYFNIIILGIADGQLWLPETKARVDICIAKIGMQRRKDGNNPFAKIFEKAAEIQMFSPSSPKSSSEITIPSPQKCPVISIPAMDLSTGTNGHTVRSYKLIIRVTIPQAGLQQNSQSDAQTNNHLNNRNKLDNHNDSLEEPKAKRRRSAPMTKDRENFIYEGKGIGGGAGSGVDPSEDLVIYTGHISLYENNIPGDKISEADFDLQLKRATKTSGSKISSQRIRREISWENFDEKHTKILEQARPPGKCAKVSVALRGSYEKLAQFVEPPTPLLRTVIKKEDGALKDESTSLAKQELQKSCRVIYQFIYGNNSQQTESRDDLRCPWCSLNCMHLYSLLKHLKLCHPRYQFTFSSLPNGAKIGVSINESFDGSYSGSAFDLVSQPPGEAFARNGPTKRTEVFSILVCRPKPCKQSLQEFFEFDEKDVDQRRTYITGHNRLYHHTSTCLPIHPREIDVDSEGEPDPEWLRVKTTMMIDEFTDVNEGEKELMKMWNLHVMKYNYVGDCQIPLACKRFVELHGKELITRSLYRNFCLHLTNLFDFGLLPSQGVHTTIQQLHSLMKESATSPVKRKSVQGNNAAKNGVNGLGIKVDTPLKSFTSCNSANGALHTSNIKTGSSATITATAVSSQITVSNSNVCSNNNTTATPVAAGPGSAAAVAALLNTCKVKVSKLGILPPGPTVSSTRNK